MTWRDEQDEILEKATSGESVHRSFESGEYTEESLGYARSFLESVSKEYGGVEGLTSADESVLYQHHDGRHVWAAYRPDSVTIRGDELTVDRFEDILTSGEPRVDYFRNRTLEGGSQVSTALRNFGGLFTD